jgi:hypothetical protein
MNDFGEFEPNVYENLPEDPEQAFLLLEEKFRAELDAITKAAHPEQDPTIDRASPETGYGARMIPVSVGGGTGMTG